MKELTFIHKGDRVILGINETVNDVCENAEDTYSKRNAWFKKYDVYDFEVGERRFDGVAMYDAMDDNGDLLYYIEIPNITTDVFASCLEYINYQDDISPSYGDILRMQKELANN